MNVSADIGLAFPQLILAVAALLLLVWGAFAPRATAAVSAAGVVALLGAAAAAATTSMREVAVRSSAITSTRSPYSRASRAVCGPIAATSVVSGMGPSCTCTCSATEPLVTRMACTSPSRTSATMLSGTGMPTVR